MTSEDQWARIQEDFASLNQPQHDLNAALSRLRDFYVAAYSLKDALKAEKPSSLGVEDALNGNNDLLLLADLANLVKHGALNKVRSGSKPSFGIARIDGVSGQLSVTIIHAGRSKDGIEIARAAVAAWRKLLLAWGIAV